MNCSRHLLLFSTILLSAPAWCGSGKTTTETIQFRAQSRKYQLFVPKSLPSTGAVPLLVTLHGSGGSGAGMVEQWKALAAEEQVIVAGPDSRNSASWSVPADGPDLLHEIVERLKRAYPIDPRRVYLFGHSAGAIFTLQMSMRESQYFAAAALHAGALNPYEAVEALSSARRQIPIAVFAGMSDRIVPIDAVRGTCALFRKGGFPVELIELPGHDHDYYGNSARINRQVWDFLKQVTLPAEPHYEPYQLVIPRSPAVASEFLGTWEGTLAAAGRPFQLILKLATDDGGTSAVMFSPDQGAEIPVSTIEQQGTKLVLMLKSIGGKFRAEISPDGTRLSGRWSESGIELPLNLKKRRSAPLRH
jgi:predicted esterase